MEEKWINVLGYEGLYLVSNLGNVKSNYRSKKILKPSVTRGYYRIVLSKGGDKKNVSLHRVVLSSFVKCIDNSLVVNHIDGNKLNNCIDNLEWVTRSENQIHAYKLGLQKNVLKDIHPMLKVFDVYENGKFITQGGMRKICRDLNLDRRSLRRYIIGELKYLKGYSFVPASKSCDL